MRLEDVAQIVSPVYQVGGSVRDEVRGVAPKDYDFATPLSPDNVEARIKASGRKAYTIGKRFGTVGFKLDGELVEVTTFRSESYVEGSRKPVVSFVENIYEDLARRDFTMNALARDEQGGLIDPFNGATHIHNRLIRAVGNPVERLREDPLRILRALRFQAVFGFNIDPDLMDSMIQLAPSLLTVSKERWVQELDKMIMGRWVDLAWSNSKEIRKYILPELCGIDRRFTLNENLSLEDRWCFLLQDVGLNQGINDVRFKRDAIEKLGRHLKWSNFRIKYVMDNIR